MFQLQAEIYLVSPHYQMMKMNRALYFDFNPSSSDVSKIFVSILNREKFYSTLWMCDR